MPDDVPDLTAGVALSDIPSDGDVIVGVAGRRLTQRDDLADLVGSREAGEKVSLEVIRDGKRRTVQVELGKRPEKPPRGG